MDQKRLEAAEKLLAAAREFWAACRDEGQLGAVQWIESECGELLIFTRGEYREQLMAGVHQLPTSRVHYFQGEVIPPKQDT